MSLQIKSITVLKESNNSGEAHVKLVSHDDNAFVLFLNKFIIDLNSGTDIISVVKYKGTNVFGGQIVEDIKDILKDVFTDTLQDKEPGLYIISMTNEDEVNIEKLN